MKKEIERVALTQPTNECLADIRNYLLYIFVILLIFLLMSCAGGLILLASSFGGYGAV